LKTAIVTGASRGIGKAVAKHLLEQNMNVTIIGKSDQVYTVADEFGYAAERILPIQADITEERNVLDIVENTLAKFGDISLLVNNAAVGYFKPLEEIDQSEWTNMFALNVHAIFMLSKAVIPHMKSKKEGMIINISSDLGLRTVANATGYAATKHAVQGLSGSLYREVRPHGIKVGTINPGAVKTLFAHRREEDLKDGWLEAEDVAAAVWYMYSTPPHVNIDHILLHPLIQNN
jgi:NADP-dependent 3-hydroxy acid dehydrogenase YdfG